jgi:hypothetical protein
MSMRIYTDYAEWGLILNLRYPRNPRLYGRANRRFARAERMM